MLWLALSASRFSSEQILSISDSSCSQSFNAKFSTSFQKYLYQSHHYQLNIDFPQSLSPVRTMAQTSMSSSTSLLIHILSASIWHMCIHLLSLTRNITSELTPDCVSWHSAKYSIRSARWWILYDRDCGAASNRWSRWLWIWKVQQKDWDRNLIGVIGPFCLLVISLPAVKIAPSYPYSQGQGATQTHCSRSPQEFPCVSQSLKFWK